MAETFVLSAVLQMNTVRKAVQHKPKSFRSIFTNVEPSLHWGRNTDLCNRILPTNSDRKTTKKGVTRSLIP